MHIEKCIHVQEEFEYTKGVIRINISKKNRQRNGQKKKVQKDKQRSTKHTHKNKDRVTRTPLKPGGDLMCSGRVGSSCSTSGTRRDNLVTNPVIRHGWGKDNISYSYYGGEAILLVTSVWPYHYFRLKYINCVCQPQRQRIGYLSQIKWYMQYRYHYFPS
jgi:hypothetical protein